MIFLAFIQTQNSTEQNFFLLFLLFFLCLTFIKTHQTCPCPAQHHGCYSIREDGSGYCFSCQENKNIQHREYSHPAPIPEPPPKPASILNLRAVPDSHLHCLDISKLSPLNVPTSPFWLQCQKVTGATHLPYGVTTQGLRVAFWYRDYQNIVRNAKLIHYTRNGFNRDKTVHPRMLYKRDDGYIIPFFAEEFLPTFANSNFTDIFFIESEKSALYAQATLRDYLWLGTSSSSGCTRDKIERVKHLLADKRLFVLFDADEAGDKGAETALRNFERCGLKAKKLSVSDIFPAAEQKWDIADCILAAKGVTL